MSDLDAERALMRENLLATASEHPAGSAEAETLASLAADIEAGTSLIHIPASRRREGARLLQRSAEHMEQRMRLDRRRLRAPRAVPPIRRLSTRRPRRPGRRRQRPQLASRDGPDPGRIGPAGAAAAAPGGRVQRHLLARVVSRLRRRWSA